MSKPFMVGTLELAPFSDGILKTSLDFLLGMERPQAEELVGDTVDGSLFIPVNNFLFRKNGAIVLIDAGAGNTMQPTLGRLPANLKGAGLNPSDITHIVITHIHPDHANGLVDDAGDRVASKFDKTIVIASKPLRYGSEVVADDLEEVPWNAKVSPVGAFFSKDEVTRDGRRFVLTPIAQGEPVLRNKLTEPGQRALLSALLDAGRRAVTIRVDDVRGVAGFELFCDSGGESVSIELQTFSFEFSRGARAERDPTLSSSSGYSSGSV